MLDVSLPSASALASATPASGSDTVALLDPEVALVLPPLPVELVLVAFDVELTELEPPPLDEVPLEPVVLVEALAVEPFVVVPTLVAPVECDVVDDELEVRVEDELPVLADEPLEVELEVVLRSPVSDGGALELSLQPATTTLQIDATSDPVTNRTIGLAPWAVSLIM